MRRSTFKARPSRAAGKTGEVICERAGPRRSRINHDDYHAKHVGLTADGRQFFLTTPFVPALHRGTAAVSSIALFLFDLEGDLLDAKIEDLGPRAKLDRSAARQRYQATLDGLGEVEFGGIDVAPFTVRRFGTELRPDPARARRTEDDVFAVEMQPGNYMAFFAPWDRGFYDT